MVEIGVGVGKCRLGKVLMGRIKDHQGAFGVFVDLIGYVGRVYWNGTLCNHGRTLGVFKSVVSKGGENGLVKTRKFDQFGVVATKKGV